MTQRTVALVQARMGSTRFPGKMLAPLAGHPVLHWVLARLQRARRLDAVVLATSDLPRDQPLVALAQGLGVATFTGSETDVLGRFAAAARASGAQRVVRVCADNPFICPGEIDRLLAFFDGAGAQYACNHLDRLGSGYADGFGAEVLDADLLLRLDRDIHDPRLREHVTLALWEQPGLARMAAPKAPPELAKPTLRFDIDHPDDLLYLEQLCHEARLGLNTTASEVVQAAHRQQPATI